MTRILSFSAFGIQVAEHLLSKEVLTRDDMIELIGERPFKEKTTYDEFLSGTGDEEDITANKEAGGEVAASDDTTSKSITSEEEPNKAGKETESKE